MNTTEMLQLRMQNQQLLTKTYSSPKAVVGALGAVQAQDFLSAKQAIAVRLNDHSDAAIEAAIAQRAIVRTWLMRGTLQIVAAQDIRWMLSCFGPRVLQMCATRYRQLGLDAETLERAHAVLRERLHDGVQLTREDLADALAAEGIPTSGPEQRLAHIFQHASYHQLICAGSRQGNQYTFTLLDDHVPESLELSPEDSLAELARRYFTTRGPATLKDFMWWTGLNGTTSKKAILSAAKTLKEVNINGEIHWMSAEIQAVKGIDKTSFLLPAFDEYVLAYRDRSAVLDPTFQAKVLSKNGIFHPVVIQQGKVSGTWKRTIRKTEVALELFPFGKYTNKDLEALEQAIADYGHFVGKPVAVRIAT